MNPDRYIPASFVVVQLDVQQKDWVMTFEDRHETSKRSLHAIGYIPAEELCAGEVVVRRAKSKTLRFTAPPFPTYPPTHRHQLHCWC